MYWPVVKEIIKKTYFYFQLVVIIFRQAEHSDQLLEGNNDNISVK